MALNKKANLPGGDLEYNWPLVNLENPRSTRNPQGVYANYPASTPKYQSLNGRDHSRELTVARLYLSGGDYKGLPGVARWFHINSYVGFFLQEVTERNSEKSQIIPMNGDGYAAFFSGREPRVYSYAGVVLNTQQDQWRSILYNLYEEVFRGSKVAGMNRLVQIAYDDKVVSGSMMNMTQVVSSSPDETFAKFTFDILVAAVHDAWMCTDEDFRSAESAFLGEKTIFPDIARTDTKEALQSFVTSQYVLPPPAARRNGGAGSKCKLNSIIVGTDGNQVLNAYDTSPTIPKECENAKTLELIKAELDVLEARKGVKDNSTRNPKDASKLLELNTTHDVLSLRLHNADKAAKAAADEAEAIALEAIANANVSPDALEEAKASFDALEEAKAAARAAARAEAAKAAAAAARVTYLREPDGR